jgi:hypothetical protein
MNRTAVPFQVAVASASPTFRARSFGEKGFCTSTTDVSAFYNRVARLGTLTG